MALVLTQEKTTYSSTYINIIDSTGDYDATDNPGGYEDPNPVRTDLNLGLVATLKASEGNEALVVEVTTPTSGTPTTVTGWKVTIEKSGWYKTAMFTAPTYDEARSYVQYDIVWEPTNEAFYYYNETTASVAGAFSTDNGWEVLEDADIVESCTMDEEDNFYSDIVSDFITEGIKVAIAKQSIDYAKAEECDKCLDEVTKGTFRLFMYRWGSEALAAVGNYVKAQDIIEKAEEIADTDTNSCGC